MVACIFILGAVVIGSFFLLHHVYTVYQSRKIMEGLRNEDNAWVLLKPGQAPPTPGEYVECNSAGFPSDPYRQITMEPGDTRLPPTSASGLLWRRIGRPNLEA
jgi:hypothetical protein